MAYAPAPVVVPHPVIIPSGGGGGGGDIPDSWAIAYIVVAILVWIAASIGFAIFDRYGTLDGEDLAFAVFIGACVAIVWPLALAGLLVWLLIRHVLVRRLFKG